MRLKGIKPVKVVKASGLVFQYYYHRATGKQITAAFGTAAFVAEVAALDEIAKQRAPRDGTLRALIIAYRTSPEFTDLGQVTRSDYDRVFDYLARLDGMAVADINAAFIYALRDKTYLKKKRRFANYVVQVIRILLGWGKPRGFAEENHAIGIKLIPRPKDMKRANRPWDDEERETVLLAAPVHLRAMIGLAMFAGLREGDACAMPKMGYDGKRIETIASKNREPIWIPAHYRLRQILEAAAAVRKERLQRRARRYKVLQIDPPVLAVTTRGTAWTESGFRAVFFGLIGELEMAGKVRPGLTFHGLRHTLGKLVIEAGGSKEDVAMILGDRSLAMGEFYSREHSKVGRMTATVHRLEQTEREKLENSGSDSGKPETGQKTGSK